MKACSYFWEDDGACIIDRHRQTDRWCNEFCIVDVIPRWENGSMDGCFDHQKKKLGVMIEMVANLLPCDYA